MEVVGRIRERHMFDCGRLLVSNLVAIVAQMYVLSCS